MRVAVVMTASSPGGVWRHIRDIACGLRSRGVDVELGLMPEAGTLRELAEAENLRVRTPAACADRRVDIWHVHLHDTFDRTALRLMALRRGLGAVVVTEHLPHNPASDPALMPGPRHMAAGPAKTVFKRLQLALAHATLVPSSNAAAFMRMRYRITDRQIDVVPLGIAPTPALPKPSGEANVLASGSMIAQKGFEVLIEAATRSRETWSLVILGDGPGRPALEAAVRAAANDRVRLEGWQVDMDHWLRAATVVCLPSRWETLPYAAIEAMWAGRPVVASAVDGLNELVEHGLTGLLVPPDDPAELANALDQLASDQERAHEMGLRGHQRAASHYGLELMLDRTLDVYRTVLARARRRVRSAGQA